MCFGETLSVQRVARTHLSAARGQEYSRHNLMGTARSIKLSLELLKSHL